MLYMSVLCWSMMCYMFVFFIVFLSALYSLYLYSSVHHGVKSVFINNLTLLSDLNKSLSLIYIFLGMSLILLSSNMMS